MNKIVCVILLGFLSFTALAQSSKAYRYTARDCYNLKGEVRTFMTSTGDTLRFDRQGELIDRDGNRPLDFSDEWHEPFVISFPDEFTRHESRSSESIVVQTNNWFVFDHQGRIVRKQLRPYIEWQEIIYLYSLAPTYVYERDFPSRAIIIDSDDEDTTFYFLDYEYKEFDDKGNWVSRRVISRMLKSSDTDIAFMESLGDRKQYKAMEVRQYTEFADYTYY